MHCVCFSLQLRRALIGINVKCWFLKRGGKPEYPEKSRVENQQTQPTYDAESGKRTQATLGGGKCSHHWLHHPCIRSISNKEKMSSNDNIQLIGKYTCRQLIFEPLGWLINNVATFYICGDCHTNSLRGKRYSRCISLSVFLVAKRFVWYWFCIKKSSDHCDIWLYSRCRDCHKT